jgi:hypothetical protein
MEDELDRVTAQYYRRPKLMAGRGPDKLRPDDVIGADRSEFSFRFNQKSAGAW